jgi:hypothetical protein
MGVEIQTKSAVTVSDMARMVGLSRARFYQLQKAGVFPLPVYSVCTHRPIYVEELQELCLEVRRRNCGINGQPVMFYARRQPPVPTRPKHRAKTPVRKNQNIAALVEGLNALGLATATAAQIEVVTKQLYPNGTAGIDQGEVLRAVFLELRRRNSGGNAG